MRRAVEREHMPVPGGRHHPMIDDGEWALIEPIFVRAMPGAGRRPAWPMRLILEAVLFVLRTGCQWRHLPAEFPPRSTVHRWFVRWTSGGTFDRLNHRLVMLDRERAGRAASPTAAAIDSQSVRTTTTGGTKGFDGGKKIVGSKRHILVDTDGRLLVAGLSPASLHDSRGAVPLLSASRRPWPFVETVFADAAYRGPTVAYATAIRVEIVSAPPGSRGFVLQKRRWVVERTFAWLANCRRLVRDYERLASNSLGFVVLAAAMILVRRLKRKLK